MSKFSNTVYGGVSSKVVPVGDGKFDAQMVVFSNGEKGLLKAKPFATDSFRGIPKQTMPYREVATYLLDKHVLDFGVVPETLLVTWQNKEASIQNWCEGGQLPRDLIPGIFDKKISGWKTRISKLFSRLNLDDLLKIVLLDLIVNNVDRHGKNILIDPPNDKVWAIDNGLTFGRYYRQYRSVFHKYMHFSEFEVPAWVVKKLKRIERSDLGVLDSYLTAEEVEDTWLRIQFILKHLERLAFSRMGASPYLKDNNFPSYEAWFKRQVKAEQEDLALVYAPVANS